MLLQWFYSCQTFSWFSTLVLLNWMRLGESVSHWNRVMVAHFLKTKLQSNSPETEEIFRKPQIKSLRDAQWAAMHSSPTEAVIPSLITCPALATSSLGPKIQSHENYDKFQSSLTITYCHRQCFTLLMFMKLVHPRVSCEIVPLNYKL